MAWPTRSREVNQFSFSLFAVVLLFVSSGTAQILQGRSGPKFSSAVAFDKSAPLRDLASTKTQKTFKSSKVVQIRPERGPVVRDTGFLGDAAVQRSSGKATASPLAIPSPLANFEGLSNQDNFNIYGGRVNPPDPDGDVGPNHYVEMINLVFAVYSKNGALLLGPVPVGALWAGFSVPDCTDPSGDSIVLYDQFVGSLDLDAVHNQWSDDPTKPFWNCVAISTTGDPTGSYYRYAFETEHFQFFPDYPKYGVWTDSYVITTREFGPTVEYGIGVYALEKNKMVNGQPARAVSFFLDGNDPAILPLVGDGLLPTDVDGKQKPKNDVTIPLVGTQDDGAPYGATFDALNIWDLNVKWRSIPVASLSLVAQLPVAAFDSIFPCAPTSRDCLPQPGS